MRETSWRYEQYHDSLGHKLVVSVYFYAHFIATWHGGLKSRRVRIGCDATDSR